MSMLPEYSVEPSNTSGGRYLLDEKWRVALKKPYMLSGMIMSGSNLNGLCQRED